MAGKDLRFISQGEGSYDIKLNGQHVGSVYKQYRFGRLESSWTTYFDIPGRPRVAFTGKQRTITEARDTARARWDHQMEKIAEEEKAAALVQEFAEGKDGCDRPEPETVDMVARIIADIQTKTDKGREWSVDDDGAFSFESNLRNGLFIMCEISVLGGINAGLYETPNGPKAREFMAEATEEELRAVLDEQPQGD